MADVLLEQLLGWDAGAGRRVEGDAAMVRDLWLGGMPLPRAAAAAGLTIAVAEETLRTLGFDTAPPGRPTAASRRVNPDGQRPDPAPRRALRHWTKRRAEVARLYGQGRTIRDIAAALDMHQREVWRQLDLAGVTRRPRGAAGVVLSRPALERLYVHEGLPVAEVARRFEVGVEAVVRNLERHGLPRRDPQTPLDPRSLRRLYVEERLGVKAVASRLGVSADKVRGELGRLGIPIRPPGRPGRRNE